MNMKRIAWVLMLVMAAVLLTACGNKATPSPAAVEATVLPIPTQTGTTAMPEPTAASVVTPTRPAGPAGVVATVNGEPITEALFDTQIAQVRAFLEQQGLDVESEEGKQSLYQASHQVLEQMIDQELVRQAAHEMGIAVSDEKVDAELQKGIEQSGGREKLDEWLATNNMTYEAYREAVRMDLLANAVRDNVVGDIPAQVPQVHARHILLNTREEAEAVLAQLNEGADFAELAKEKSLDIGSRDSGGDLGFFPASLMVPAFAEAAFALQADEISEIVETPFGFHIIQVLEVDPARDLPEDIRQRLWEQKFRSWLQQRREEATIERYLP